MADIELVIKIPEDVYTRLFDNGIQDNEIAVDDICEMARSIRIGIPLPKGHGRLIDADATLKKHCVDFCREKPSCYEDCGIYDLFHLAPTIIEAGKGE